MSKRELIFSSCIQVLQQKAETLTLFGIVEVAVPVPLYLKQNLHCVLNTWLHVEQTSMVH